MSLKAINFPKPNAVAVPFATVVAIVALHTLAPTSAADVDANAKPVYAEKAIAANLAKLGLDRGCEIVTADSPDLVENTAAEMLQKFLAKGGLQVGIVTESNSTGKKRFLLGRESHLKAIKTFGDRRRINIRNVSAEDDGFHLKRIGDEIVVAGANPRGVLYGVYAFEDFVNAGASGKLDIRKVPFFSQTRERARLLLASHKCHDGGIARGKGSLPLAPGS